MSLYTLLLPDEYASALVADIKRAKKRINLLALVISEDESTRHIIDALCQASERGVRIDIGMDLYFTYKELGQMSSRWSYFRSQVRQMRATKKRLEASGIKVRWLGQFGATLFSRRTHVKWSIVDDTVYSFGGINLYHEGLANNDYFFRSHSPTLAERLSAEHELIISTDKAGRSYPSHRFTSEHCDVLIDGGRMFDSIIYRRAVTLAKRAERIVYVSQYCPTGKLSRVLKKHHTEFYFNHWKNADDPLNRTLIRFSSFFHRITTSYTKSQYLHAKFMLFYLPDDEVVAISGSHNFVAIGGTLGTREVAAETSDKTIVRQLERFLETQVRS